MGHGGARAGAGRPKKPLTEHWLRGTWKEDRHGERPRHVHAIAAAAPEDWRPATGDLDQLGDPGRQFVERLLEGFKCSHAEGVLVLECGHATDALAALRGLPMDGKTLGEINTIQRLEITWSRQLAALLCQLRVTHATTTT